MIRRHWTGLITGIHQAWSANGSDETWSGDHGVDCGAPDPRVYQPQQRGYMTVFSCGRSVPMASNLNYVSGETVANSVLSESSGGGKVCVYASSAAHLIVDVNGSFSN